MLKKFLQQILERIRKRYRRYLTQLANKTAIKKWHRSGGAYPVPHAYKRAVLLEYAAKYKLDTLIETGTLLGDMPYDLQDDFANIYSIELNIDNYLNAKERFHLLNHIEIIKGESSEQLGVLLKSIRKPALFWLDTNDKLEKGLSEFSIKKELAAILGTRNDHIVIISDARLMKGINGHPGLIEIRDTISALRPDYHFEVDSDIIRAYPDKMPGI